MADRAARGGMPMCRRSLLLLLVFATALTATIARAQPAAACDPGLAPCQQLDQKQQEQNAAAKQLDQILQGQQDAQTKATAIATLVQQLQGQVAAQQAAVAATQARVDDLDRQIRFTQADIMRRQAHLAVREQLLGQRVRGMAQQGSASYLQVLVTSTSFNELVDRTVLVHDVVAADQRMVDQVREARDQVQASEQQLQGQRAQQASLLATQRAQQQQLNAQLATQQRAFSQEQQLLAGLQSQGSQVQQQLASLSSQVQDLTSRYQAQWSALQQRQRDDAARAAASPNLGAYLPNPGNPLAPLFSKVPPNGFQNTFPFGQCTWWAAFNHPVNWSGNATDWWDNARSQGVRTSQSPSVGAIAVWSAGPLYSIYGHVAIVTRVLGGGAFEVSEMNYYGEGIVDTRTVTSGQDLKGFIP
jgi:peptidoglycan hydrolase CwlO-like protein